MRITRSILLAIASQIVATGAVFANQPPSVTYVWAHQRPGTQIVDVSYNVADPDGDPLTIQLFLSADGGQNFSVICVSASGAIGSGIQPGNGKLICWNAGRDAPGLMGANYALRVIADDGHNVPNGFVLISPGNFTMGSPIIEPGRWSDETMRETTLTHSVLVGSTEVTNQQYIELVQWAYDRGYVWVEASSGTIRDNLDGPATVLKRIGAPYEVFFSEGAFSCINPQRPVKHVTWFGAAAYCDWLSMREGIAKAYNHGTWLCNDGAPYSAVGYCLPTEAEWEYACRAGSATAFANGQITYLGCEIDPNLNAMGWYCGNSGFIPHDVATKLPNSWRIYDMHGNLWEWCNDWYAEYGGAAVDPVGPAGGWAKAFRGGGPNHTAALCRSARRLYNTPALADESLGFRVVRHLP